MDFGGWAARCCRTIPETYSQYKQSCGCCVRVVITGYNRSRARQRSRVDAVVVAIEPSKTTTNVEEFILLIADSAAAFHPSCLLNVDEKTRPTTPPSLFLSLSHLTGALGGDNAQRTDLSSQLEFV
jgi:hypothetical protein